MMPRSPSLCNSTNSLCSVHAHSLEQSNRKPFHPKPNALPSSLPSTRLTHEARHPLLRHSHTHTSVGLQHCTTPGHTPPLTILQPPSHITAHSPKPCHTVETDLQNVYMSSCSATTIALASFPTALQATFDPTDHPPYGHTTLALQKVAALKVTPSCDHSPSLPPILH